MAPAAAANIAPDAPVCASLEEELPELEELPAEEPPLEEPPLEEPPLEEPLTPKLSEAPEPASEPPLEPPLWPAAF